MSITEAPTVASAAPSPRLCRDCRHIVLHPGESPLYQLANATCGYGTEINLVTGEPRTTTCDVMRHFGACGIGGAYWEPHP